MRTPTRVVAVQVLSFAVGCCLVMLLLLSMGLPGFIPGTWGGTSARPVVQSLTAVIALVSTLFITRKIICHYNAWEKVPYLSKMGFLGKILLWRGETSDSIVAFALTALNFFSVIAQFFTVLNMNYFEWISGGSGSAGTVQKIIDGVTIGVSVGFTALMIIFNWWPKIMMTDCLIGILSSIQIIVSIVSALINTALQRVPLLPKQFQVYVCLSWFLACVGFTGLSVLAVVRSHNRLSPPTIRLGKFYIGMCVLGMLLCIAWLGCSLSDLIHLVQNSKYHDVELANPILAFCGFWMCVTCIFCAWKLLSFPKTKLRVEKYDLTKCTERQLEIWANVIDAFNSKSNPDVANGSHALDLLKAYAESPMPGFECVVLRVYDKKVADTEKQQYERSYEEIRAWENMDDVSIFGENSIDLHSITTLTETEEPQKLSKSAAKKAQRKAAKKSGKKDFVVPDFNEKTAEEIEQEQLFMSDVRATEALVMLTTIRGYDLTSPIGGKFGKFLQRTLGARSWFKPLCVNFGIIGTHWPFRQALFVTAPSKKPNARNAAILSAIAFWNDGLDKKDRCAILYNPSYGRSTNEQALKASGWIASPAMPSHVVDLRPYKGKTIKEYLKAIKYRNQAVTFNKDDGKVIETTDFSPENCKIVFDLWRNIADKRTSEGHTAVLKEPSAEFIQSLGAPDHNAKGWRKLLFLKVDDEIIASCVLFFLGNTLTSDIQGLEHEKARHYKAYFVMMQETLTIALRDGISFVDFGPTTAKPKLDIGCSSIPLIGGIRAKQPLATMVGLFANQVDV